VPRARSPWTWRTFAAAAVLVVLTVAAYSDARHLQFVPLDDQGYVYENPHVTAGLTLEGVRWAFTSAEQANWHPLTWLSHMLDVQLFGLDAGYHHVTSVVIHALNTLLLFFFLARATGATGRSACVAALFAVHPLHVESVAWVAERKDVLSTFFWLLTMWAYVWYVSAPGRGRFMVVVASLALGLMSKPMLVTLPFVLLLIDVWPLGRFSFADDRPAGTHADARAARVRTALALVREKLPLFVLSACSSVITVVAQSGGGAVRSLDVVPVGVRVSNAVTSYVMYLVKAVWPVRLAVFYPLDRSIHFWPLCGALAVLSAITWLAIRARRRQARPGDRPRSSGVAGDGRPLQLRAAHRRVRDGCVGSVGRRRPMAGSTHRAACRHGCHRHRVHRCHACPGGALAGCLGAVDPHPGGDG
jgi:hypothetical protein